MTGIIHLLIGSTIALLIPDTPTMFVVAFFSHYLFDFIPHIDPATFVEHSQPYTARQKLGIAIDAVLIVSIMVTLIVSQQVNTHILIGALVSQLPDLLSPLEKYKFFYPFHRFHAACHWDKRKAKHWAWYIAGLINPIIVCAICLFIIARLTRVV